MGPQGAIDKCRDVDNMGGFRASFVVNAGHVQYGQAVPLDYFFQPFLVLGLPGLSPLHTKTHPTTLQQLHQRSPADNTQQQLKSEAPYSSSKTCLVTSPLEQMLVWFCVVWVSGKPLVLNDDSMGAIPCVYSSFSKIILVITSSRGFFCSLNAHVLRVLTALGGDGTLHYGWASVRTRPVSQGQRALCDNPESTGIMDLLLDWFGHTPSFTWHI